MHIMQNGKMLNVCAKCIVVRDKGLIYADCPLMVILVTNPFPHYDVNDDDHHDDDHYDNYDDDDYDYLHDYDYDDGVR